MFNTEDIEMNSGIVEPWQMRRKAYFFAYAEGMTKKRYRKKLIKLCSKRKLSAAQLEKIRYGITQNIDEKILEILVDPKMEPERMGALIGIALAIKGER